MRTYGIIIYQAGSLFWIGDISYRRARREDAEVSFNSLSVLGALSGEKGYPEATNTIWVEDPIYHRVSIQRRGL
jgi:hypothetical protein